ncbi:unnamed protein product, partial [Ectocarpus sp. 12 AP-2014]
MLLAGAVLDGGVDRLFVKESKRRCGRTHDPGVDGASPRSVGAAHPTRPGNDANSQGADGDRRFEKVRLAFGGLFDGGGAGVENEDVDRFMGLLTAAIDDVVAAGIAASETKMGLAFQSQITQALEEEMGTAQAMQRHREAWWKRKLDGMEGRLGGALAAAVASQEGAMAVREGKCAATVAAVCDDVLCLKEQAAHNAVAGEAADDAAAKEKAAVAELTRSIAEKQEKVNEGVARVQLEMQECFVEGRPVAAPCGDRGGAAMVSPSSVDHTAKLNNVRSDIDYLGSRLLIVENAAYEADEMHGILYRIHESVVESTRVWGTEPLVAPLYTDWLDKLASAQASAQEQGDNKRSGPRQKTRRGKRGSKSKKRE